MNHRTHTLVSKSLAAAVLLALACAAGAAPADQPQQDPASLGDLSMEELLSLEVEHVYGASRYEQKVTRVPSSVTVVSSEQIRKQGYRTLTEVLRSVRGLYASDDRNYSYLGIRGFLRPNDYNTRVLVLIDGHRINDNLFDSGTIGREGMLDIDAIERVEVIRGPSSSIYGSSAFLGVVNVITRQGAQVNGVEIAADAGSFDTYRSRITLGDQQASGLEWLFSAAHYDSEGDARLYIPEFDQRRSSNPLATNNGVAKGIDDERSLHLFGKLGLGDFGMTTFFSERVKSVPTASFGTAFNDGRERTTDYRGYVDFSLDHDFSATLNLQGRLFYDNYTYYGTYPYGTPGPEGLLDEALLRDDTVGDWIGTQWQLTTRLTRHTLMLGGEYRNNIREHQSSYYDFEPRVYNLKDDRSSKIVSVFAQDEMLLTDEVVLTAGLRYDNYVDGFGSTVNPRLGLIYNPGATTTFKALYGEAFRAPTPYEGFYNVAQREQPALRPETIRTVELVAEQYVGTHYRLSASLYHYDIHGLISQTVTEDDLPFFANLESAEATGLELEARAEYASGLRAQVSYALQRAEDQQRGRVLSSSPRHLAKLGLLAPLVGGKLSVGLDLQYNGSSATLSGGRADDFLTTSLTLSATQLLPKLDLSVSVYNLFDVEYGYPGAIDHAQEVLQQDGRTVRGSLTYRF